MASTSTNVENQTPPEITFYVLGEPLPNSKLPREVIDAVLATVRQQFANMVPTTYEASKAYLDEEILKPEGKRDLRREMCVVIVIAIPDNQDIDLRLDALGMLVALRNGTMLVYPTVDLPPTAFGTFEDQYSDRLVDRKTGERAQASIMLAYFSRTGDTLEYIGDTSTNKKIQVNASFFN